MFQLYVLSLCTYSYALCLPLKLSSVTQGTRFISLIVFFLDSVKFLILVLLVFQFVSCFFYIYPGNKQNFLSAYYDSDNISWQP